MSRAIRQRRIVHAIAPPRLFQPSERAHDLAFHEQDTEDAGLSTTASASLGHQGFRNGPYLLVVGLLPSENRQAVSFGIAQSGRTWPPFPVHVLRGYKNANQYLVVGHLTWRVSADGHRLAATLRLRLVQANRAALDLVLLFIERDEGRLTRFAGHRYARSGVEHRPDLLGHCVAIEIGDADPGHAGCV